MHILLHARDTAAAAAEAAAAALNSTTTENSTPTVSTRQLKLRIFLDVLSGTCVLIFFGLRFWHQRTLKRKLVLSEVIANTSILLSTAVFITWAAFSTKTRVELIQWYKHPVGLPPPITQKGHQLHFVGGFAYVTALWLVKSAFLATYYKLIPTLHTKVRVLLYFTSVFTALTFTSNILLHGLYCLPIQTNWTSGPHNCTTFRSVPSLTANTFTNIVTDLLIMALPLFIIHTLKLRRREGWALGFVFLVGSASLIASLLRWAFIFKAYRKEQDQTGAVYKIEIIKVWTTVEISTASIAFCLPALRNLLRRRWWPERSTSVRATVVGRLATLVGAGEKSESDESYGDSGSQKELTDEVEREVKRGEELERRKEGRR